MAFDEMFILMNMSTLKIFDSDMGYEIAWTVFSSANGFFVLFWQ